MRFRVTLVALSVLVVGACGGSKASDAGAGQQDTAAASTSAVTGTGAAAPAAGTTTSVDANNRGAQFQAYRACLAEHGVTLPSVPAGNGGAPGGGAPPSFDPANGGTPPSFDPNNPGQGGGFGGRGGNLGSVLQDPANAAAVTACAALAPQGGTGGPGGGQGNGQRGQAFQAYQSCLKDHGVEVPTTVAGGQPASIDRSSPAFAAADEVCKALLPQRANGSTTTTTGA